MSVVEMMPVRIHRPKHVAVAPAADDLLGSPRAFWMTKFIKCHFGVEPKFRGCGIRRIEWMGNHTARVTLVGFQGTFDVPDWWIEKRTEDWR